VKEDFIKREENVISKKIQLATEESSNRRGKFAKREIPNKL
jgi:hypothetical protein